MNGLFIHCRTPIRVLALVGLAALAPLSSAAERPNSDSSDADADASLLQEATSIQVVSEFDAHKVRDPSKWRWFCYDSDGKRLEERVVEKSKLGLRRVPKSGPVAILYDTANGVAYWRWTAFEPKQLFKDEEYVDLQALCFGPDPRIGETWARLHPDHEVRYVLDSRLVSLVKSGGVLSCSQIADFLSEDGLQTVGAKIRTTRSAIEREERTLRDIVPSESVSESARERSQLEFIEKAIKETERERNRQLGLLEPSSHGSGDASNPFSLRKTPKATEKAVKAKIAELNLRLVELNEMKETVSASARKIRESKEKIASLRSTLRKLEREEALYSDLPKLRELVRETIFTVSVKSEGENQP